MATGAVADDVNEFERSNRWDKVERLKRRAVELEATADEVDAWDDIQWAECLASVQHQTGRKMGHPSALTKKLVREALRRA